MQMGVAERYRPISSAMEITGKFTAQCHGAEDVRDARLDCGMGVDNPRRQRVVASADEGAAYRSQMVGSRCFRALQLVR